MNALDLLCLALTGLGLLCFYTGLIRWNSLAASLLAPLPFLVRIPLVPHHLVEVGDHGFLYASALYQTPGAGRFLTMQAGAFGGIPVPEHPFLAGEPLNFYWIHNVPIAWVGDVMNVPPGLLWAITGLMALFGSVWMVHRLAKLLPGLFNPTLAIVIALFANSVLGPAVPALGLGHPFWEVRGIPVAGNFVKWAFPLGIFFSLVAIHAFVSLQIHSRSRGFHMATGFLSTALAGLFYPFSWIGLVIFLGALGCTFFFLQDRRRSVLAIIPFVAGSLCVFPYFLSLQSQGSEPTFRLETSIRSGLFEIVNILLIQGVLLLFAFPSIKEYVGKIRITSQRDFGDVYPVALVTAWLAVNVFVVVVWMNEHIDYKVLTFSFLSLGLLASPVLARLAKGRPLIFAGVLGMLLIPLSINLYRETWGNRPNFPPTQLDVSGFQLKPANPQLAWIYSSIGKLTPGNAVIIENTVTLAPVFSSRSAFVGRNDISTREGLFGFGMPVQDWLGRTCGHPAELLRSRSAMVDTLYSGQGDASRVRSELVTLLAPRIGMDRPIFAVARTDEELSALLHWPFVKMIATSEGASILQMNLGVSTQGS